MICQDDGAPLWLSTAVMKVSKIQYCIQRLAIALDPVELYDLLPHFTNSISVPVEEKQPRLWFCNHFFLQTFFRVMWGVAFTPNITHSAQKVQFWFHQPSALSSTFVVSPWWLVANSKLHFWSVLLRNVCKCKLLFHDSTAMINDHLKRKHIVAWYLISFLT